MTSDIERLLRATYAASADLVDESAPDRMTGVDPRIEVPEARRWRDRRNPMLVAAAIGVIVVGAVVVGTAVTPGQHPSNPVALPAVSDSRGSSSVAMSTQPPPSSQYRTGPADPQVGVGYPFDLYTHCGIDFTRFGGRYWQAAAPLPEPSPLPDAQGVTTYTGYVSGVMTLVDQQTARFVVTDGSVTTNGQVIMFIASPPRHHPARNAVAGTGLASAKRSRGSRASRSRHRSGNEPSRS